VTATRPGPHAATPTVPGAVLRRWPTWLGIAVAVVVGLDLGDGADLAPTLPAMALIYLAAAALRKPSAAWPLFPAAALVILATEALAGDGDATWVFFGLAAPLVAYALWPGTRRADRSLLGQAIAMVGFGAVAAVAVGAGDDLGAYLVAAGLVGHAIWDAYHHRVNMAVARSYAECCCVLDAAMAVAVVIVTVRG
jgi:hypothetical protein